MLPRVPRYWLAVALVIGFAAAVLMLVGSSVWGFVWLAGLVVAATVIYLYRDQLQRLRERGLRHSPPARRWHARLEPGS